MRPSSDATIYLRELDLKLELELGRLDEDDETDGLYVVVGAGARTTGRSTGLNDTAGGAVLVGAEYTLRFC